MTLRFFAIMKDDDDGKHIVASIYGNDDFRKPVHQIKVKRDPHCRQQLAKQIDPLLDILNNMAKIKEDGQ
jgi:hypothetical protein